MKRTGFKNKNYPWRKEPKKNLFPKKESKDEEWRRIKIDTLDPYFKANGLYYTCELEFSMCIGNALTMHYAHSKKRDDIARDEPERTRELCEVVRACPACHDYIEHLPRTEEKTGKQQMYEIVINRIDKRNKRLARWKKVVT